MPIKMSTALSIPGENYQNDSLDVHWQRDDVTTVSEEVNCECSN